MYTIHTFVPMFTIVTIVTMVNMILFHKVLFISGLYMEWLWLR